MLGFISDQILFYVSIILVLFMPGYSFISAVFAKDRFSSLEKLILSFGLSILITDFLMIALSKFKILFTETSLISTLLIFSILFFVIDRIKNRNAVNDQASLGFSKKQSTAIILIIFITVLIKIIYLQNVIVPSSTDLGHHMYWAKSFAQNGQIGEYVSRDIITDANGAYRMSQPQPISDFIIGEHLIFSAIAIISGLDFLSYFPIITLFLVNIFSLLSVFILTFRIFEDHPKKIIIAILSLLLIGPLFAIDPPQAKYVAGGVVGNIIGNLLTPLAFYFYVRFFKERRAEWIFGALLFSMGLFYTHHLSALIFLLSLIASVILLFVFNFKETKEILANWKKYTLSPIFIGFIVFSIVFIFFIYTPSYLKNSAVDTVIGEVKKIEHTGLTFFQFKDIIGEPRVGLSLSGLFFAAYLFRKNKCKSSLMILFGWTMIIGMISLAPSIMKLSIPSGRVANFAVYPFSILSALAFISIFSYVKSSLNKTMKLNRNFIYALFFLIMTLLFSFGFNYNSQYLVFKDDRKKIKNTFDASAYLASRIKLNDNLISDHIYITADSWTKLYFMRDYNFPLYRANLERYENKIDKKEFCTLWMISEPGEEKSRQCFNELGVNFVMVNKITDSQQFLKLPEFSKIYSNNDIAIFFRN